MISMTTQDRLLQFDNAIGGLVTKNFRNYLIEGGFFTAPASTKYHGSYTGGLFDHSIVVMNALVDLTKKNNLKWMLSRSPYIVGMFHDLCKIDSYIKTSDGFDYNENILIPGHGEKSVQLLAQHVQLTEEEVLCIRWHMGAYDDKSNWDLLGRAIEKYSTVLWTHTADMIAARVIKI